MWNCVRERAQLVHRLLNAPLNDCPRVFMANKNLAKYRAKRDFKKTPEPQGAGKVRPARPAQALRLMREEKTSPPIPPPRRGEGVPC